MKADQQAVLRKLTTALDHRYRQMNGGLCDAINILEHLLDTMAEDNPAGDQVHLALSMLVAAANEGAELQNTVNDTLHQQLAQARSIKAAYLQGWDARLLDLLTQPTPEQAAAIHARFGNTDNDDEVPF